MGVSTGEHVRSRRARSRGRTSVMARPVDHRRRQELLDDAVDYVVEHGLGDLSLRPLAAAIGTSAPVLLHHFDNKEQLLVLVLGGVRDRLRAVAAEAAAVTNAAGGDRPTQLEAVWAWVSAPEREAFFRLFFEGYAVALRRPDLYAGFLDTVVQDWLDQLTPSMSPADATLAIAAIRGLLLDLLATDDRRRVDAAAARLPTMLAGETR